MVQNTNLKTVFNNFPEIFFPFYEMLPNEIVMVNAKQILISPIRKYRFALFQQEPF